MGCHSRSRSRRSRSRGHSRGGCAGKKWKNYCKTKCRKGGKKKRRKRKKGKSRRGRITRNPFFNFLLTFRAKHKGWSACKIAIEGARKWCCFSDKEKHKFRTQACSAPKFRRRKGRSRSRGRSRRRGRRHGGCGGRRSRKRRKSRRRKRICAV